MLWVFAQSLDLRVFKLKLFYLRLLMITPSVTLFAYNKTVFLKIDVWK